MEDIVAARHGTFNYLQVLDRPLDYLNWGTCGYVLQVGAATRRHVVEDHHFMPLLKQKVNQMTANEAAASSHQRTGWVGVLLVHLLRLPIDQSRRCVAVQGEQGTRPREAARSL